MRRKKRKTLSPEEKVLFRKVEHLLDTQFKGDFIRLFNGVQIDDFFSPLPQTKGGRSEKVSRACLRKKFRWSPYQILHWYCKAKRLKQFAQLKPYHLPRASSRTYQDRELIDEMVCKLCDHLLRTKFECDLHRMLTEGAPADLLKPFPDIVAGHTFLVNPRTVVGEVFGWSAYRLLSHYRRLKRISVYRRFKPYHMRRTPAEASQSLAIVDEVLVKKLEQIRKEKFDGSYFRLFTETSAADLRAPLDETLAGRPLKVSTIRPFKRYGNSPYRVLCRYREIKHLNAYRSFRPYHLKSSPKGTFADEKILKEVLKKKIEQLRVETFGGSHCRLTAEVTLADLRRPLYDTLAGETVEVGMAHAILCAGADPSKVLLRAGFAVSK